MVMDIHEVDYELVFENKYYNIKTIFDQSKLTFQLHSKAF